MNECSLLTKYINLVYAYTYTSKVYVRKFKFQ